MRNSLVLNILQTKNATKEELLCNKRGTFVQRKTNIRMHKCKRKGTRLLQKRNFFQGDATRPELFKTEMQQKRNF